VTTSNRGIDDAPKIYSQWGGEVKIVRLGTLEDVKTLDYRKPDKRDREAVKLGSYVVARSVEDGKERLYHLAYLRADGGAKTIDAAIKSLTTKSE
jgi:hypothetical protein